jgi:two-component system LytT family response regulator
LPKAFEFGIISYTILFKILPISFFQPLGDIEELLPADIFQRIHHSTVVNLNYVTHFVRSDGGYVKLQTGEQLTVSKSKKESVMERLGLKKD